MILTENKNTFETCGASSFEWNETFDAFIVDIPQTENDSLSYLALKIASRARYYYFATLYQNKDSILYCDTDSIIVN